MRESVEGGRAGTSGMGSEGDEEGARTDLDDGLDVERADRAQVDDLDRQALLGERVGRLDRVADRLGVADDRDVGPLALNLGLADGEDDWRGGAQGGDVVSARADGERERESKARGKKKKKERGCTHSRPS